MPSLYILAVLAAAVLVLIPALSRTKSLHALLPGGVGGLLGLAAVCLSGLSGTPLLAFNLFTGCVAFFMGIPGVIGLLLLRLISVM